MPCALMPLSEWQAWQIGALPIAALLLTPASGTVPALPKGSRRARGTILPALRSPAPWTRLPSRAVLCHSEPETPATAAAVDAHFQFRHCLAIFTPTRPAMHGNGIGVGWGGGKLLSSYSQPAEHIKFKSHWVKCLCMWGLLNYPGACLGICWFLSLLLQVSRCLHKEPHFRTLPMPSEFNSKRWLIRDTSPWYSQSRTKRWAQISWPLQSCQPQGISGSCR